MQGAPGGKERTMRIWRWMGRSERRDRGNDFESGFSLVVLYVALRVLGSIKRTVAIRGKKRDDCITGVSWKALTW